MELPDRPLDPAAARAYGRARDLIGAVVSNLSSESFKESDPERREELIAAFHAEEQVRDRLSPFDTEEVARIIREYPARLRRRPTP